MRSALAGAIGAALRGLGIEPPETVGVDRPANVEHGDWSSNIALVAAKAAGQPPRKLAERIVEVLDLPEHVATVEIAGPGFLNFRLAPTWRRAVVEAVASPSFGHHAWGGGERVQVEFVSANPTGPLHVGNGRWAAYGDALARLLEATGHRVSREYYVNDTGNQIRELGESLLARRRGDDVPEGGYQGAYVTDLAARYDGPDDVTDAGRWAAAQILENIRAACDAIGVHFDEWYSQASIEESEAVHATIGALRQRGVVYEQEGATWLRTTEFGDSRDRVLRKSNGDYTYLGGDLAYHRDKFLIRGFDRVIDIFGADHQGQVASLKAGAEALGVDPERLEILIGQLVSVEGRQSKRKGNIVALHDVVAEIGADSARFLFLLSSVDTAMTLDLDVAVKQDLENPVYYVQMGHARVCSIAARASERGIPLAAGDPAILDEADADAICHLVAAFPEAVDEATRRRAPHKLATWCREIAGEIHGYYHRHPVLPAADDVRNARFTVLDAARIVLGRGLGLLGVSAPEEMAKLDDDGAGSDAGSLTGTSR